MKITTLPTEGTLALSGTAVAANQAIPIGSVSSLVYTPNSGYTGSDSFGWNGSDGTNYAAAPSVNITVTSSSAATTSLTGIVYLDFSNSGQDAVSGKLRGRILALRAWPSRWNAPTSPAKARRRR